jgi:hypothetical protein
MVEGMGNQGIPPLFRVARVEPLILIDQASAYSAEGSLFAHLGKHEIFTPTKPIYPPMTVGELAAAAPAELP